ncbi:MAG: HAD family hydrolase [Nitrospiria bacterium]
MDVKKALYHIHFKITTRNETGMKLSLLTGRTHIRYGYTIIMLKAIIFDFNGIIANDESIHFKLFAKVMAGEQVVISREEYNQLYLHLNDHDAFMTGLQKHNKTFTPESLSKLIHRKTVDYNKVISTQEVLFPDAPDFIRKMAGLFPLAIASGALNAEIEFILKRTKLEEFFPVIIGAEKAVQGKPHPECYLNALQELNTHYKKNPQIKPPEVLVIEDSIGGIEGAHRAGMVCLAVTNSYPKNELNSADFIVDSLSQIDLKKISPNFEK